ncbi:chorismate--pyruvate lyase family protein [Legionella cardiaca]|uniref:Chorismate lyase n=1 Tax=Legionella cardiaca TaxID=1071983 RepID=A0ABY8AYA0_9GAMM|nr:chorismate lyase [Legionella cardiaca]WED44127.1 chorismate lyase [Legionella cardiaca]
MLNQTIKLGAASSSPPKVLLPWLKHEFSLTDKLKNEVGDASLTILNQQWKNPSWWDKFALGISTSSVMHREIIMSAHGTPCWYARTIIPDSCYQKNFLFFNRLNQESLGVIIFNTPQVKRNLMLQYAINASSLEYYWLPHLPMLTESKDLWSRLSIFSLQENVFFYLVEIFLPDFLRTIN